MGRARQRDALEHNANQTGVMTEKKDQISPAGKPAVGEGITTVAVQNGKFRILFNGGKTDLPDFINQEAACALAEAMRRGYDALALQKNMPPD